MTKATRTLMAVAISAAAAAVPVSASGAPQIAAPAFVVIGGPDGAVLAQRAQHTPRAIASITKLMTVLVALEHAQLDDVVTVSSAAAAVGESTVSLRAGETLTVRELALATLIPSANDAATALADHVGRGSLPRFVALMNAKARALGMTNSHFVNPHGLDAPGHLSTAHDVVTLLRAALRNPFIQRASITETASISGDRPLETTDDLIGEVPGLIGGKTGHTNSAGWSQVAAARSRGSTVYAAVLGDPSEARRDADLTELLHHGLASYAPVVAISSERTYAEATTGWGRTPVSLVATRTIVKPIRVGRSLVRQIVMPTRVSLPVTRGQRLGLVRVLDGDRLVASSPLVAAETVARPGSVGRARYYAERTFHNFVGLVS
jgi:serine-type D-Ala-D-Ala carboxypeptidase (penicillin-binding protein 5/6)